MIRIPSIFRTEPLRLAALAGLLSVMLLFTAMPVPAADSAQEQVSSDFQQTVTLGAADVENGYGMLTVRDAGPGRWNNAFGSIELTGAAGNVSVSDNNGSVQVSDVKGTLEVRNRFASITARSIQGAATITGGNGAVI